MRPAASVRALRWPLLALATLALLVICGPWWSSFDPITPDWGQAWLAPEWIGSHPLGTDAIGRDVYARLLAGARLSLLVALSAGALALVFGGLYGAICGFYGGWPDLLGMRLVDALTSVPLLLVAVVVVTILEPGLLTLVLVLATYLWLDVARLIRAESARIRGSDYMLAAQIAGVPRGRQLLLHLLPNLLGPMLLALTLAVPQAVLVESFLSFLGLGPGEAMGSLGSLLAEGAQDLQQAPWLLLAPTVVLLTLLGSLRALANRLREALGVSHE
ncbi:MAG: ABC transporter permease [Xanthomonadales bacterium]|nr:ABC transporter permease [Xanthomonadales bacterium]